MDWLSLDQAQDLAGRYGTPLYVYSKEHITQRAKTLLGLTLPSGHTVRYAVKANPHPEIIQLFDGLGLHFDASSSYEASQLLKQGIDGQKISLSSQQPPHNLSELIKADVELVATSLHQLELFLKAYRQGTRLGLRVNPGIGSGHNNRTSTGGVNSSFGLWHEYVPQALKLATQRGAPIMKLHVHIGSGADPKIWGDVIDTALEIAAKMQDVTVLDIGGGYKIKRADGETEADMQQVGKVFADKLDEFGKTTSRRLHLEIEPGTWLVGHGGSLLTRITDVVDTGRDGRTFLRVDTGMNDILRPTLYGAQHQMEVISASSDKREYVVVGHNCETGDILTPSPGDSEGILPRSLNNASIGDLLVIYDAGAYCASMATKGYNAFLPAKEIIV